MTDFDEGAEQGPTAVIDDYGRADWADLQSSLADLAGLVAASLGLEEMLERVASFAAAAIPGADGASVILVHSDDTGQRFGVLLPEFDHRVGAR